MHALTAAQVPPRRTEARRIAEAVVQLLDKGAEAASEDLSWTSAEGARGRSRTLYRGLRELGVTDVSVTIRQGADQRWRWYAQRVRASSSPPRG